MKILYSICLICSILNVWMAIQLENKKAAVGWLTSFLWLIVLLLKEFKNQNR